MKKVTILILLVLALIFIKDARPTEVMIPKSAIRFRVIAASDSKEDQQIKEEVRNAVQEKLTIMLEDSKSLDDTRKLLSSSISAFEETVKQTLDKENSKTNFQVQYGSNFFPEKKYRGVSYPEGSYESLVITLGEGLGKNWWCVLFPPLCILEAEDTEKEEVEYKFWIQEMIEKYL